MSNIREFRGYNRLLKRWFYGGYVDGHIVNRCVDSDDPDMTVGRWVVVEDYTVSQNTGLRDFTGVELYEGDLVNVYDSFSERYFGGVLEYRNGSYCIVNNESINYRLKDYVIMFVAARDIS